MSQSLEHMHCSLFSAVKILVIITEKFELKMEVHNCSYFIRTMTLFSMIYKHFNTIHQVWMLKCLKASHLSETTKVNTFTSTVWLFVYFHCNKI